MLTRMFLQCLFLPLLVIPQALANTEASREAITSPKSITKGENIIMPGCQSKCGNLIVPYPFGVGLGSGCSAGRGFDINCNTSFSPPKPFIGTGSLEVVDIADDEVRIKNKVAFSCYNRLGNLTSGNPISIDLVSTPYTFSDANKFTIIGCDEVGLIGGTEGRNFASGCVSLCSTREDIIDGECTGIGCCQIEIPKGLKEVDAELGSIDNHTKLRSFDPCGFAFLSAQDSFVFHATDFLGQTFYNRITESVPIVLDWALGTQNCTQAQKSLNYSCKLNSRCVDSDSGFGGYRCSCREGYEGNPYLTAGCSDINECKVSNPCHEHANCINTPGSFNCFCRHGYTGDGRKDDRGCIARSSEFPVIKFSLGITASVGFLFLVAASFVSYKLIKRRRVKKMKEKFFKRNGGLLLQKQLSTGDNVIEKTTIFTAVELEKATDNFNENRILGRGGQGTVYKGMLTDGRIVAVKRSKLVDESQVEQFVNEVAVLSQVVHMNVVKLIGCCLETEVPLLVYEFIANGTLFDLIHNESDGEILTWNVRLRVASEAAGALAYLHSSVSIPIYHRDIKSTNILLDEKYTTKVSDFGTSRTLEIDKTHITTLVKGTFGYLDPEYFQSSLFTEKSDVYSFGVVLAELLTGQKAISWAGTREEDNNLSLVTRFLVSMEENCLEKIVDAQVSYHDNIEDINAVAKLAERCLNLNGKKRPTMKEVAFELERVRISSRFYPTIPSNLSSLDCIDEEEPILKFSDSLPPVGQNCPTGHAWCE